ncbi:Hypothetical predicted protein, partial [Pelobates cultripes]
DHQSSSEVSSHRKLPHQGQRAHDMPVTRQGPYATKPYERIPAGNWRDTDWGHPHRLLFRAPTLLLMGIG